MKQTKFKGNLKRQFNEGTLSGDDVPFKINKHNKPKSKTIWERFKEWLIGIT